MSGCRQSFEEAGNRLAARYPSPACLDRLKYNTFAARGRPSVNARNVGLFAAAMSWAILCDVTKRNQIFGERVDHSALFSVIACVSYYSQLSENAADCQGKLRGELGGGRVPRDVPV